MAHTRISAHEFIREVFVPQVAVLCSEEAETLCTKNNLKFIEMIQPFAFLKNEAIISDPNGNKVTLKKFKVNFQELYYRPPQPVFGKKILNAAVENSQWIEETSQSVSSWSGGVKVDLNLQSQTPWFEDWRSIFLEIQYPSDHEFIRHYISCIFVVSAGGENPLDELNRLCQLQHQQQHQSTSPYPKWFSPNILKFYLLLHDVQQVPLEKTSKILEQMKSTYGSSNCHVLQINSSTGKSDAVTNLWTPFLKHRNVVVGSSLLNVTGQTFISSGNSSGTATPREDVSALPTKVLEDFTQQNDLEASHPLSPMISPVQENGISDFKMSTETFANDISELNENATNSLPTPVNVLHGSYLSLSDIERIKCFMEEYITKSLIPYVERQIRYLNDIVVNRSKSKSLFSATKRWLVSNKPTSSPNSVIYNQEAAELQTRRLGDLCFIFGLYEMAYNSYHTAKNDFKSDQAWLYFAGAQEMTSLALFMQNNSDYQRRYLDSSLHTYLNICKVYNFAIRLTLLSTEILKHHGEYGEAASLFIKMTSEESDLLSGLMLEQAAHCFINSSKKFVRKYAFHMTLAGHRMSKAGQRVHSLRAYKQAFQVYRNRDWRLAEDHIHYAMGKQAYLLKLYHESLLATLRLIDREFDSGFFQSESQQVIYLREFLHIVDKCCKEDLKVDSLSTHFAPITVPIPILYGQRTKILIGDPVLLPVSADSDETKFVLASNISFTDDECREERWLALEREILTYIQGRPVMVFNPNLSRITNFTLNTNIPVVPLKERVSLELCVQNPLLIDINISDVKPVYDFENERNIDHKNESIITQESIPCFNLSPKSEQMIHMNFYPQLEGHLNIKGISYRLSLLPDVTNSVEIQQSIKIKGPRLNNTLTERTNKVYRNDTRLKFQVISPMPKLSVSFNFIPPILSSGEIVKTGVSFTNFGDKALSDLHVVLSQPQFVFFSVENSISDEVSKEYFCEFLKSKSCTRVQKIKFPSGKRCLEPKQSFKGTLWIHAPPSQGTFDIELLFYYKSEENKKRYRLLRHLSSIFVYACINLVTECLPSHILHCSSKDMEKDSKLKRNSLNINLHIENKCVLSSIENGEKVEIIGVGVCSPDYCLIPDNLQSFDPIETNESCQLNVQCARSSLLKENNYVCSSILTNKSYNTPQNWQNFALLSRVKFSKLTSEPTAGNPMMNYDSPPPTLNEIQTKMVEEATKVDLLCVVMWKSKRGNEEIKGTHIKHVNKISTGRVERRESEVTIRDSGAAVVLLKTDVVEKSLKPKDYLRDVVKIDLKLPKIIQHDFTQRSLCLLQYSIDVYNSSECPIFVQINLDVKNNQSKSQDKNNSEYVTKIRPIGVNSMKFHLKGYETKSLARKSIVSSPGSYSLGSISCTVARDVSIEEKPICEHKDQSQLPKTQNFKDKNSSQLPKMEKFVTIRSSLADSKNTNSSIRENRNKIEQSFEWSEPIILNIPNCVIVENIPFSATL